MNTLQVEATFIEGQKGKQDALTHYNKQQIDQLNDLIRYLVVAKSILGKPVGHILPRDGRHHKRPSTHFFFTWKEGGAE